MMRLLAIAALGGVSLSCLHADDSWPGWFSPALRALAREEISVQQSIADLGTPVTGQTVAEYGYQHTRLDAEPPTSPWLQVDLGQAQRIDWVALMPAQVDWQTAGHKAHAFPRRFRIDLSDDPGFERFLPLAVFTDADFPDPGIAPVTVQATGKTGRYVRLTVTKLAVADGQHFFALAELMVLSGDRNIAIGRTVTASATVNLPPRWAVANLVDGRTPLGPPIVRDLLPYDGLYAGPLDGKDRPWMSVDLGEEHVLQEIRLHPVHARIGADVPGFAFPARFRVEAATDRGFSQPRVLFDTGEMDFPNPGNNPVTLPVDQVVARHVRITMLAPSPAFAATARRRFGLSEIEVFSGDKNVARNGTVAAVPDPMELSRTWPLPLLVDGFASYGRIVDLPSWLASWQRRVALGSRLDTLRAQRTLLESHVRRWLAWGGLGLGLVGAAGGGVYLVQQKRRRARELDEFRTRLARDLHDEIGSNLAGLALLSEHLGEGQAGTPAAQEDWREVNRIARESTDAMREVLWLLGARQENGIDLLVQLRAAAARVLPGRRVSWQETCSTLPQDWPLSSRRQVFLFFKEALANIARHARATEVVLSATVASGTFELAIADNGVGFTPGTDRAGVGLGSLRERARALRGSCTIESAPGHGTRVVLRVPIPPGSAPALPANP